jgi:CRP/FNR family transcriptional regulator, anaerobic regulatory protein
MSQAGLMMYYKLNDGIEIPADFTIENEWLAYLKSFTTGTASDMYIKALEDTHLLVLSNTIFFGTSQAERTLCVCGI